MQKVSVIARGATELVLVDFSGCKPGTYAPVVEEARQAICQKPARSVRVVTLFEDLTFDMGTVKEMQEYASAVMPHLRRCALVGIDGLKKVVFGGIKPLFDVPVELCKDLDAAKEWVAQD